VIIGVSGDPMKEAAGGVKVLSEKTWFNDNFQNDLVINDLQIRFQLTIRSAYRLLSYDPDRTNFSL